MDRIIQQLKVIMGKVGPLAFLYEWIRDTYRYSNKFRKTPFGFWFIGDRDMQKGTFEIEEGKIFSSLIGEVDMLLNVGANVGYYCCIALSEGKKVIAFEPVPLNLQFIMKNVRKNNWGDQIEIFPLALSNQDSGFIELYGGGTGASLIRGWAGSSEKMMQLVPCNTLDNIIGDRLRGKKILILVDIEGAELFLLEGASKILEMDPKPVWMVEISYAEHQPEGTEYNPNFLKTFQVFWDTGYKCFTANEEKRLITPSEVENVVSTKVNTLQTHNFLFME